MAIGATPGSQGYPAFYLGPLGRLMAIAVPSAGAGASPLVYGVLHQNLSGTATKDVFGQKWYYQIPLESLDPRAFSWIEMLLRGAVAGPFYLLDPRRRNRLGPVVSGCGINYAASGVSPWQPASGTVTVVAANSVLLPSPTNVFTPGPTYALTWVPTAAGVLVGGRTPIPVLPGESVCFSCYCPTGSPSLELVPYSAAGVAGGAISGTVNVPGTLDRKYISYTTPTNGAVAAVLPQIRAAAAGTFITQAWQLTDGTVPEPWVMGGGIPKVVFDQVNTSGASNGMDYLGNTQSGSLTLYEA
jgi:hypothetical protein